MIMIGARHTATAQDSRGLGRKAVLGRADRLDTSARHDTAFGADAHGAVDAFRADLRIAVPDSSVPALSVSGVA